MDALLPRRALRDAGRDWARGACDSGADSEAIQLAAFEIAADLVPSGQLGAAAEQVLEGMIDWLEDDQKRRARRAAQITGGQG